MGKRGKKDEPNATTRAAMLESREMMARHRASPEWLLDAEFVLLPGEDAKLKKAEGRARNRGPNKLLQELMSRPLNVQLDGTWTVHDVESWARRARPHVRRAILLLATVTETLSSVELAEHVGVQSGGQLIGGLRRAAARRGLQTPVVRHGDGWRFRSPELAGLFESVLAESLSAEQVRR